MYLFTHVFRPQDRFRKSIWVYCLCRTVKKWVRLSCLKSKITRVMLFYPEKSLKPKATHMAVYWIGHLLQWRGGGEDHLPPPPHQKKMLYLLIKWCIIWCIYMHNGYHTQQHCMKFSNINSNTYVYWS